MLRRADRTVFTRVTAPIGVGLLLLGALTACAPEPGAGGSDAGSGTSGAPGTSETDAPAQGSGQKGSADKGSGEQGSGSWPEDDAGMDAPKQTALPVSFPVDRFIIPKGAVIDDAGERSDGEWFVVLRAPDQPSADATWDAVLSASGFAVVDPETGEDGGVSAELTSQTLEVSALTLPQPDGTVLLSYDISG